MIFSINWTIFIIYNTIEYNNNHFGWTFPLSICVKHPFIICLEQYIFRVTSLIPILFYDQFNQPECMLMTHLLSAVFNGIEMLSLCHIHFRQELINLISYIKRGGYRAMSECSKYQLLLQTDYIRLREKYEHLYIYSYILSYIALMESSQLFLKQNMLVPSGGTVWRLL